MRKKSLKYKYDTCYISFFFFFFFERMQNVQWGQGRFFCYKQITMAFDIWGAFNKFPDFFVQAFRIVVDSWKFSMLLLYDLWDDWPIFMISASNEQLRQQLEYTLLKPDCHSWRISKIQSGREDTLEERYAIKFCFKLRQKCHRNVWNASDCFSTILHKSSIGFWVA